MHRSTTYNGGRDKSAAGLLTANLAPGLVAEPVSG